MRNTFNRIIVLLTCVMLLVAMVAFPASAEIESIGDSYFDVMDYSYVEGTNGSNFFRFTQNTEIVIPHPFGSGDVTYVDMVINCAGGGGRLSQVWISPAAGIRRNELTVETITTATFRVYGSIQGENYSNFYIELDTGTYTGMSFASVEFFQVGSYSSDPVPTTGRLYVNTYHGGSKTVSMSSASSSVSVSFGFQSNVANYQDTYISYIYLDNWKKFDYMDILCTAYVMSIDSINCYINNEAIPFSVSYLDMPGDASYDVQEGITEGTVSSSQYDVIDYGNHKLVNFIVRVDLTNVKRSSSFTPVVDVRGTYDVTHTAGYVSLQRQTGYIVKTINQWQYWFTNLKEFITDLFAPDEDTVSDLEENTSEIESITGELNSVERPNMDNVDPEQIVIDSGADTTSIGNFFIVVIENPFIYQGVFLALVFGLCAYVLYGKR